jgi:hypothetical protein
MAHLAIDKDFGEILALRQFDGIREEVLQRGVTSALTVAMAPTADFFIQRVGSNLADAPEAMAALEDLWAFCKAGVDNWRALSARAAYFSVDVRAAQAASARDLPAWPTSKRARPDGAVGVTLKPAVRSLRDRELQLKTAHIEKLVLLLRQAGPAAGLHLRFAALPQADRDEAIRLVLARGAPATMKAYLREWGRFQDWCGLHSVNPFPPTEESTLCYLLHNAHGLRTIPS